MNNIKPFLIGGFSTSFNLASNEDNPEDNATGTFRSTSSNFSYELGFGIDIYLYYFKFTPSIRGVFGLNDQLVRDKNPNSGWTKNIEKMIAGNLTIDKLQNLKHLANTVDVSGALETNKVKDINKIKEFIAEVKKISHEN